MATIPLVIIPSRGRPSKAQQKTAEQLRAANVEFVIARTLIDDTEYPADYEQKWFEVHDIATKREAIFRYYSRSEKKHIVIDDDILFRHHVGGGKSIPANSEQIRAMLEAMSLELDTAPIVSVADRFRIHDRPPVAHTKKMCNVVGFNRDLIPEDLPGYRVRIFEDLDITLQLLDRGLDNTLLAGTFTWSQVRNASGGCNTWRTNEVLEEANKKLCDLWPGIVRSINGNTRVHIMWQKCLKQGIIRKDMRA